MLPALQIRLEYCHSDHCATCQVLSTSWGYQFLQEFYWSSVTMCWGVSWWQEHLHIFCVKEDFVTSLDGNKSKDWLMKSMLDMSRLTPEMIVSNLILIDSLRYIHPMLCSDDNSSKKTVRGITDPLLMIAAQCLELELIDVTHSSCHLHASQSCSRSCSCIRRQYYIILIIYIYIIYHINIINYNNTINLIYYNNILLILFINVFNMAILCL